MTNKTFKEELEAYNIIWCEKFTASKIEAVINDMFENFPVDEHGQTSAEEVVWFKQQLRKKYLGK